MINLAKDINIKSDYLKIIKIEKKFSQNLKKCEICGKKKFEKFQSIGRIGKPLEYGKLNIVICKFCSHKFTNPRFQDSFYKKYYKKNYRKIAFGDLEPSKEYQKFQKLRGDLVFNFFKKKINLESGHMLDHGCASGLTMLPWKRNNWKTYGIDPHEPSVELGNKKFLLNIKKAFGENLPFSKNKFDLILSLGSLEHSYDLSKSLKEITRTLKKDGLLIIRWRSSKLIGSPLEYYNHNHYRFFTKKTWNLLLKSYGFSSIKHIDKDVEGYKSYLYIIAKNAKKKIVKIKSNNDFNTEIKKSQSYVASYYKKCIEFEKLYLKNKTSKKNKIKFLKKHKINLLNIGKLKAMNRFFSELISFLKFLRKYEYINESR